MHCLGFVSSKMISRIVGGSGERMEGSELRRGERKSGREE